MTFFLVIDRHFRIFPIFFKIFHIFAACYVTARAGVELMTLRLKVIDSTKAPSRPTIYVVLLIC